MDTLIVWDLFAAHRDSHVLSFLRAWGIDVIFVPGGCTGVCQVMDVVVNRSLKGHVRDAYVAWRGQALEANLPWSKPRRSDAIKWVLAAWEKVPLNAIHEGMLKHVVLPATTTSGASVELTHMPPIPTNVDEIINVLANLELPPEVVSDGTGSDESMDEDSDSDGNPCTDETENAPNHCMKCEGLLCEASRTQCPQCGIWLHTRCFRSTASSSKGMCVFCP